MHFLRLGCRLCGRERRARILLLRLEQRGPVWKRRAPAGSHASTTAPGTVCSDVPPPPGKAGKDSRSLLGSPAAPLQLSTHREVKVVSCRPLCQDDLADSALAATAQQRPRQEQETEEPRAKRSVPCARHARANWKRERGLAADEGRPCSRDRSCQQVSVCTHTPAPPPRPIWIGAFSAMASGKV